MADVSGSSPLTSNSLKRSPFGSPPREETFWMLTSFINDLKIIIEVQMIKGLWWIPRHPETKKGVASDEMLREAENKH